MSQSPYPLRHMSRKILRPSKLTAKIPSRQQTGQEITNFCKEVDDSWHLEGEKEFKKGFGEKRSNLGDGLALTFIAMIQNFPQPLAKL